MMTDEFVNHLCTENARLRRAVGVNDFIVFGGLVGWLVGLPTLVLALAPQVLELFR